MSTKKMMKKKVYAFVIAMVMLFVTILPSVAVGLEMSPIIVHPQVIASILAEAPNASVLASKPLYNAEGEISAYYYAFSPTGYAVVSMQGIAIEYSLTVSRNIPNDEMVYYGGPLSYFTKSGAFYKNVYSGEECSIEEFVGICESVESVSLNAKLYDVSDIAPTGIELPIPETIEIDTIPYSVDASVHSSCTCGYGGICTAIASAILLMYYDNHICPGILPSNLAANGNSLTHYLLAYIIPGDLNDGANVLEVADGLNTYISQHSTDPNVTSYAATVDLFNYSLYQTLISGEEKPCILGVINHPTYMNHAVVGYGWKSSYLDGSLAATYVTVADGWGSSGVNIHTMYIASMVVLE